MLLSRPALALCVALAAWGCGFPTIGYDSEPETTATGEPDASAACAAPKPCDVQAEGCGKQAEATLEPCLKDCKKGDTGCTLACEAAAEAEADACITDCESCAATKGCADATASCKALVESG